MDLNLFEKRKSDHLRLAMDDKHEAQGLAGFNRIHLFHEALPELNFSEIKLNTKFWNYEASSPFFISSMTAGHSKGEAINISLARVAGIKKWPMGLGSQRRELTDPNAKNEWANLRKEAPNTFFFSNLGLAQLIHTPLSQIQNLVESLHAGAIIIHLNALQEAIQPEGTPNFKGGLAAIEKLCKEISIPVIVKETGCGFTKSTMEKIINTGVKAIDIGGFGGTHWGRIEATRAVEKQSLTAKEGETFAHWGESTVNCLLSAGDLKSTLEKMGTEIWASGGIRSGLDAAKSLALGAHKVGIAKPALSAVLNGEEALANWMNGIEHELKVALFCTGSANPSELQRGVKWQKI